MKTIFKCLIFFFSFSIISKVYSQECDCKISEVENNTVEPCDLVIGTTIIVDTVTEFRDAINQANSSGGNRTILIADGTYQVASATSYPYITANNLVIRSLSGNRDAVILTGGGMQSVSPNVENGVYVAGNNVTIADLTIKEVGNHGIAGNGDDLFVHNVKIQNTYEQMLKITTDVNGSHNGKVQCSLFEYPSGVGPQFYIGGIDMHRGINWVINDNVFKNIASPSGSVAEHAIHLWNNSDNNTVERNMIINCDRGIGFGLGVSSNNGGIIRNNMIYNDGSNLFDDVGISLETSPNTKVYNNTIYIEYTNAIEYRFTTTINVDITNNLTNKLIRSRNGGQATLNNNYIEAQSSWFINPTLGNLRLNSNYDDVVDQGANTTEILMDIDKVFRVNGDTFDIGAQEYSQATLNLDYFDDSKNKMRVFPNPVSNLFTIKGSKISNATIKIYNSINQEIISYKNVDLTFGYAIDTSKWQAGVYMCKVSNIESQSKLVKLIVSK